MSGLSDSIAKLDRLLIGLVVAVPVPRHRTPVWRAEVDSVLDQRLAFMAQRDRGFTVADKRKRR